jgi:hypothetical protein
MPNLVAEIEGRVGYIENVFFSVNLGGKLFDMLFLDAAT